VRSRPQMPADWRLYLDECIDIKAEEALAREGVDTASSHTAFRNSAPDDSQLAYAAAEGRTLLTHNLDFIAESAKLLAAGNHHAGVLLARDRGDLKLLLRTVLHSLQQWEPEDVKDQVWWVLTLPDGGAK
jgi:predicted nuclease of predicted toxin-antitoxin system